MTPGIKKVELGEGSTLEALSYALRKARLPEEAILQKIALGARWQWQTDVLLTGEPLTESDVLEIANCMVAIP